MDISPLVILFERDLSRVIDEIESYKSNALLWSVQDGINNSAGTLGLHLAGNLRYFIGSTLGDSEYERDRDFEFNGKVSKTDLLSVLKTAQTEVNTTLKALSPEDVVKPYPLEVFGSEITTSQFLIHLYGHLNYHLGQINYHRRLIS
jgi:hypothetical protein